MIAPSEFQRYLQSILDVSLKDIQQEVRDRYIPTLAELPLQVQTCTSSKPDSQERQDKKREQFAVLEGLRKYAPEHVLLVGKPGSGKTTSLRRLLWEESRCCVEAIEQGKSEIPSIPILIELRGLSSSVLAAIQKKLEWWLDLDEKSLKALLRDRRLLVILDGLNELPNDKAWQEVDEFRQLCADLKVPLIFTTRELSLGSNLGIPKKLEMLPLTEPQMWKFVQKRLPETGGELWRQIKGRLRELTETPLLLKLLCDVFEQNGEIPTNRGDLFRREFARRYEEFKPERLRNVSEDSRRFTFDLLSYLAFTMIQGDPHTDPCKPSASWVTIHKNQAERTLATFLAGDLIPDAAIIAKAKEGLEDLLEWHLLQVASDPDCIEFHHQLFQEYYAAESLASQLAELSDEELKYYYLNYQKWTEALAMVMTFLESEALVVRIVRLAMKVDLQLGARLAGGVKPKYQNRIVNMITDLEVPEKFKIKLLGMTTSNAAIPFLSQVLQSNSDIFTNNEVADALEKIYSPASIPFLKGILENADSQLRFKVACTLAHYGDETAIPILCDALNNKESHFRSLLALEEIDREILIAALDEVLRKENLEMRHQAVITLSMLLKREYENIVPLLIKALDDEDKQVRYQAAFILKNEGGEDALSALAKLWKDENISVQILVHTTFKGQEREDLIFELTQSLSVEDSALRKKAAETIGRLGTESQSAIEALFNVAFSDQDFLVRNSASTALIQIGNSTVIQTLSSVLKQEEIEVIPYTSNHSLAVTTLMQLRSREAIPVLSRVLKDKNKSPILRGIAAKALGEIGDSYVIDLLINIFNNEEAEYVIFHVLFALGKLGIQNLETAIITGLKHSFPSIRQEAVETLAILGTGVASSGLIQALTDEEFSVRFTAACALGRNGEKAVIPVLVEALGYRNSIGWEDSKVCEDAIEVLKCIGEAALPALENALNTLDYQVKRNAEKAIRNIITPFTANSLTETFDMDEILTFDNFNHELADQPSKNYKVSDLVEIVLSSSDDPWEAVSKLNEIASPENISQFYELIFEAKSNNVFKYVPNLILSIQSGSQLYNYDITRLQPPQRTKSRGRRVEDLLDNKLGILNQEIKKMSEESKRIIHTENYFEQGTHTHTHNYTNNETLKQQITEHADILNIIDNLANRPIQNIITVTAQAQSESMSESYQSKYDQRNSNNQFVDTAQSGSNPTFNQYNYTPEQKQNLAEAAAEIQQLLKQLEQTNPTATEAEKVAYVNDETTPSFKRRVVGALQASSETAIDEFILENKYLKVAKAAIKGWLQPGS